MISRSVRELIKIDIKNGLSQNLIMKKYDIKKKNIIREIKEELEKQEIKSEVVQEVVLEVVQPQERVIQPNDNSVGRSGGEVGLSVNEYVNSNMELLAEMIQEYKRAKVLPSSTLIIELPADTDSNFKTSIRLNKVVWEQFKEFCNDNKQFKQKELVSQALLNFMNEFDYTSKK